MLTKPMELSCKKVNSVTLNLLMRFLLPALAISPAGWGEVRPLLTVGLLYPRCSSLLAPQGSGGCRKDLSEGMATATGSVLREHEGCRRAGPVSVMVLGELLCSTGFRELGNECLDPHIFSI